MLPPEYGGVFTAVLLVTAFSFGYFLVDLILRLVF